jgi:hypothetical protein
MMRELDSKRETTLPPRLLDLFLPAHRAVIQGSSKQVRCKLTVSEPGTKARSYYGTLKRNEEARQKGSRSISQGNRGTFYRAKMTENRPVWAERNLGRRYLDKLPPRHRGVKGVATPRNSTGLPMG